MLILPKHLFSFVSLRNTHRTEKHLWKRCILISFVERTASSLKFTSNVLYGVFFFYYFRQKHSQWPVVVCNVFCYLNGHFLITETTRQIGLDSIELCYPVVWWIRMDSNDSWPIPLHIRRICGYIRSTWYLFDIKISCSVVNGRRNW